VDKEGATAEQIAKAAGHSALAAMLHEAAAAEMKVSHRALHRVPMMVPLIGAQPVAIFYDRESFHFYPETENHLSYSGRVSDIYFEKLFEKHILDHHFFALLLILKSDI
jgi:hypothetical protein